MDQTSVISLFHNFGPGCDSRESTKCRMIKQGTRCANRS